MSQFKQFSEHLFGGKGRNEKFSWNNKKKYTYTKKKNRIPGTNAILRKKEVGTNRELCLAFRMGSDMFTLDLWSFCPKGLVMLYGGLWLPRRMPFWIADSE
jgi:hypothetical protein